MDTSHMHSRPGSARAPLFLVLVALLAAAPAAAKPPFATEVRTPISALPFTITSPGSYYVTGNLERTGPGDGITIAQGVSGVTIDLMGFALIGPGDAGVGAGIYGDDASNVEIKDGTIRGFATAAIELGLSDFAQRVIGVRAEDGDISLLGRGAVVRDCYVRGNIRVLHTASVIGNKLVSGGLSAGEQVLIQDNVISPALGRAVDLSHGIVANNIIANGSVGISVNAPLGEDTVISGNTIFAANRGIDSSGPSLVKVSGNSITAGEMGISIHGEGAVTDNLVSVGNLVGAIGIDVGPGLVAGNQVRVTADDGVGIRAFVSTVVDNQVIVEGLVGIRDLGHGHVQRNRIFSDGVGIETIGQRSVIEENTIDCDDTGSNTSGILFSDSGNFYATNRASGCTVPFNLGATAQTDGGGNVAF